MDPKNSKRRMEFWKEQDMIKGMWNGACCIGGDWNIIRFPSDRLGGSKITGDMRHFSDWINSHSLVDLQLSSASSTWSNHQSHPATSKLDRFFVSIEWLHVYPEVFKLALPKHASNNCPILIDSGWKHGDLLLFVLN